MQLVRRRLPLAALGGLAMAGLSEREIEQLVIPQRACRDRVAKQQPLTVEEAERAVRLMRIQTLPKGTFGESDKATGAPAVRQYQ